MDAAVVNSVQNVPGAKDWRRMVRSDSKTLLWSDLL